jgi:hypothetical protein
MICEAGLMSRDKLAPLMQEAHELIAIFTASSKTARANLNRSHQSKNSNNN